MPFVIKKFLSQFLLPMPLVCVTFLVGWVFHRFTRFKRTGAALKLLSLLFFLMFGYGFGRGYLYRLERQYPPFDPTSEQCELLCGVPIVVLGQGMPEKSDLPLRYQNNAVFERRLYEGIRVAKAIAESHVVVSMAGESPDRLKQAYLVENIRLFGFPTNRVTMFTTARDTAEEAMFAKKCIAELNEIGVLRDGCAVTRQQFITKNANSWPSLVNLKTIVLVTSASHMPRAMKIFRKRGFSPIASPCDYSEVVKSEWRLSFESLPFPDVGNYRVSMVAMHEWLGGQYEHLMGD